MGVKTGGGGGLDVERERKKLVGGGGKIERKAGGWVLSSHLSSFFSVYW